MNANRVKLGVEEGDHNASLEGLKTTHLHAFPKVLIKPSKGMGRSELTQNYKWGVIVSLNFI